MSVVNPTTHKPYQRRIVCTHSLLETVLEYLQFHYGDVPFTRVEEGTFTTAVYFDPKEN